MSRWTVMRNRATLPSVQATVISRVIRPLRMLVELLSRRRCRHALANLIPTRGEQIHHGPAPVGVFRADGSRAARAPCPRPIRHFVGPKI